MHINRVKPPCPRTQVRGHADIYSFPLKTVILPHAIFSPEFPDGCEVKSSGAAWIITVLPATSLTENLSVKTAANAYPLLPKSGGRSPAWAGWAHPPGLHHGFHKLRQ